MRNSKRTHGNFCEWLTDVLDKKRCLPKSARWLDRGKKIFAVRWLNARSASWRTDDGELFKLWKTEGSRGHGVGKTTPALPKDMKTNFRMNLASPKFTELKASRQTKGPNAVRVYQISSPPINNVSKTIQDFPGIAKFEPQVKETLRQKKPITSEVILGKDVHRTGEEKHSRTEMTLTFVDTPAGHTHEGTAGFVHPMPQYNPPFAQYHPSISTQHLPPTNSTNHQECYHSTPPYAIFPEICTTRDIFPRIEHPQSTLSCSEHDQSFASDDEFSIPRYLSLESLTPDHFPWEDLPPEDGPTVRDLLEDGPMVDYYNRKYLSGDMCSTMFDASSDCQFSVHRPRNASLSWSEGTAASEMDSCDLDTMLLPFSQQCNMPFSQFPR